MKVRGWLIVGSPLAAVGLPPAYDAGVARGDIPDASGYQPGTWILWAPRTGEQALALVCVDIPLP